MDSVSSHRPRTRTYVLVGPGSSRLFADVRGWWHRAAERELASLSGDRRDLAAVLDFGSQQLIARGPALLVLAREADGISGRTPHPPSHTVSVVDVLRRLAAYIAWSASASAASESRCRLIDCGDSDARAGVERGCSDIDRRLRDHRLNRSRDGDGPAVAGVREQNGEFIAADARREVGLSNTFADREGDGLQHVVARLVAVSVVDLLEAVEVDQQQGGLLAVALAAPDLEDHGLFEGTPVAKSGEAVVVREPAQPLLHPPAAGDVLDLGDESRGDPSACRSKETDKSAHTVWPSAWM